MKNLQTFEEFVNESVNEGSISGMKLKALGAKLLTKISIGSEFVTDKDTYTVTDFGPKSNAFQEFFVTDSKGNAKKIKLTVMYGVKLEVNDDPRSAVYRREEMLSSINENLNERRVSFKGKTTNDLYKIVKNDPDVIVFANGKHYSIIDPSEMKNDLKSDTTFVNDEDGEEFEVKIEDIEFIEL
jgi:hypothetical protein